MELRMFLKLANKLNRSYSYWLKCIVQTYICVFVLHCDLVGPWINCKVAPWPILHRFRACRQHGGKVCMSQLNLVPYLVQGVATCKLSMVFMRTWYRVLLHIQRSDSFHSHVQGHGGRGEHSYSWYQFYVFQIKLLFTKENENCRVAYFTHFYLVNSRL